MAKRWLHSRRRGVTLIELLMAIAVIGIVARVGVPNVNESILTARGTEILREVAAIEQAVATYVAENGSWPADAPPGEVPEELVPRFLDAGFSFDKRDYTLDYDHWSLDGEVEGATGRRDVAAVSISVVDEGLQRGLMRVSAPRLWFRSGDTFGFLLQGF